MLTKTSANHYKKEEPPKGDGSDIYARIFLKSEGETPTFRLNSPEK